MKTNGCAQLRRHLYRAIFFILFNILFFIPIIVSSVSIATHIKASLSLSELLGFTKKEYDFMGKYNLYELDIIDVYVSGKGYPDGFHKEQERAMLRDYQYPKPLYFYLSILTILIFLVVYIVYLKNSKAKILKWLPLGATVLTSVFFVVNYSENYMVILETFEYYVYRVLEEARGFA
ncbi:hypothetical protein [Paenibacillus sp. LHD-38]|uniref:hypothetical protein n=1 Tax=Paenibacillus sp. LHD-38 TaxID=3072143 RepID=UPI00280E136B|nr:hypothetical protein [Paenibacillus sp. LHD-38]MDQ8736610.1 hypothetical protein [Paenibacillus sp. LHD-38]